ncbi:MAG: hypothetical protein SGJ13_19070 [Actinomycetota bacterium]|nr:hypothetical protein [Actinomycetota bacterium]
MSAYKLRLTLPLLAVAITACGGSGSSGESGTSQSQYGPEEFGLTAEELSARVEQVEGAIATCMTEAGFEYVPVDFVTIKAAMDSDKSVPGLSDEEFIAQYGYGFSTQFDRPIRENGLGEQNVRIFDGLGASDQVAYNRALYGEDPSQTVAVALENEDFSLAGGCTQSAAAKHFTQQELTSTYVNPADALILQDARMVKAVSAWSDCMRDGGYDYANPDDAENYFLEQFDAITQGQEPTTLTGGALDALTQLQGEERAVAKLATDCEDEIIGPVEEQVESEIYGSPQN